MLLTKNYFRLRLKCAYTALGVYVIIFFYIVAITKDVSKSVFTTEPKGDIIDPNIYQQTKFKEQVKVKRIIAVLVLVCNRTSVTRTMDQLLKYRPDPALFPIVLSQDCGDGPENLSSLVEEKYGQMLTYLKHPNYGAIAMKLENKAVRRHMRAYYHIAAHYSWALSYTFEKLGFDNVIIVEDDLDISPDFFEYFQATLPLLYSDKSLWCVSAYNDNGKPELIDQETPELLLRTDFFPGLGWMLTKELWAELKVKWPITFWDDWMRFPEQRKGRACIHPEISRTKTFGQIGASNGQYFDQHLKTIQLNSVFVNFKSLDLSYLLSEEYNKNFLKRVYDSIPVGSLQDLKTTIQSSNKSQNSYRLIYKNSFRFKSIAEKLGLMDDIRSEVPRSGYKGIVTLVFQKNRLYLVPFAKLQV